MSARAVMGAGLHKTPKAAGGKIGIGGGLVRAVSLSPFTACFFWLLNLQVFSLLTVPKFLAGEPRIVDALGSHKG